MNRLLITLLTMLTSLSLVAAEGFSSLEEQMTGEEFNSAGLDKLTQDELDSLNSWIRQHSVATLGTAKPSAVKADTGTVSAAEDRRGLKGNKDETPISSRILGEFTGWDGQTVFKLENGMIWMQADKDKFYIREIENPVAIIEPGMFSSWHLHIEGHSKECRVKRIQ